MEFVRQLNGIFWGWLVAGILLCTGLFFTLRLHFPQFRYFTRLFGNLACSMRSDQKAPGSVSGFGALCAAVGGVAGYTVKQAFRYGVARGLFSNDAGNGTAPSMHATAVVPHPVNQGFAAMLGTFITTIIICSCTAFCILLSNQLGTGETGIALTQLAFESNLGSIGRWIIFLAMFLFGFTTLLADIYYGEVNLMILVKHPKAVTVYRLLCCAIIIAGAIAPVPVVWDLVDFASAFMVFFNVIALVGLSKYVAFALKDYAKQWKQPKPGEDRPVWNYEHQIGPEDLQ